uniref:RRM domain-containing protein n=1 Tax=Ananas comosus var. bracteatus TaxID=296719 RepID=A0A6V7PBH8_ANACO|nr:unnamed protein product [Ananas comosus var. bracteatus]
MATTEVEFRCFVGGLAWATDSHTLEEAFRPFGEILESKIINDRETGRSRGFGFVTFANEQSMRDAIEGMNGKSLDGRSITVNEAQSAAAAAEAEEGSAAAEAAAAAAEAMVGPVAAAAAAATAAAAEAAAEGEGTDAIAVATEAATRGGTATGGASGPPRGTGGRIAHVASLLGY